MLQRLHGPGASASYISYTSLDACMHAGYCIDTTKKYDGYHQTHTVVIVLEYKDVANIHVNLFGCLDSVEWE